MRTFLPLPWLASLLGVLAACGPDAPEPIWKGKHLYYGTTTSEPVCRGSFFRQEQHAVDLARLLDFKLKAVIHYTRIAPSEVPEYCEGLNSAGCAYDDHPYAFAVDSFNFHEIAHVVANLGGINGPLPFAEGFAEVFNDGGDLDIEHAPIDEVLRDFVRDAPNYHTAGRFARFLIERHNLDQFVRFLRATAKESTFSEFAPVFEQIFGEPIELAMADFEMYPSCTGMSNRIAVVDCNLPLEPWDGKIVTLTANVTCDQDDVLGPTPDDVMITTRGFQVEQAGSYLVLASAPEGWSGVRLVKCGSCWDSFELQIAPGSMEIHDLTPGRYYALFGRMVDEPAELGLVVGQL